MVDWQRAIERNREALARIVAMLLAIVGLDEGSGVATLPRCTRNHVIRILRPAESALRRLIVVAARGVKVTVRPVDRKARFPRRVIAGSKPVAGMASRPPAFRLVDPRKRFHFGPARRYATTAPRISLLFAPSIPVYMRQPEPPAKPPVLPGDPVDATRICRRLHALKRALDDLDGQAKRLARREARREREPGPADGAERVKRLPPMRIGRPPGYRKRPFHEVDDVLRECHSLALYAQRCDTS